MKMPWTWLQERWRREREVPWGEMGVPGTLISAGQVAEEYRTDLMGAEKYRVYQQMRADPQIAAVIAIVELPLVAADWFVYPAEGGGRTAQEIADFVESQIWGIDWSGFIREAVSHVWRGVMLFEKVFRVLPNGQVGWGKFAPRLPQTIVRWQVGPKGDLESVEQWAFGDAPVKAVIPASKLLRFTYRQEGSNYEGRSILRDAYKPWRLKETLERIYAISAERSGVGIPVITPAAPPSASEMAAARELVRAFRANEDAGVILPPGWRFDLTPSRLPALQPMIERQDVLIARAALASFLNLGERDVGSYALAEVQAEMYLLALDGIAEQMRMEIQRHAVEELVRWNYGDNAPMPEIRYKLPPLRVSAFAQALQQLVAGGVVTPTQDIEDVVREMLDLPPAPKPEEREEAHEVGPKPIWVGQEWVHDPAPRGGGFHRPLTDREEAIGLREIDAEWTRWERTVEQMIRERADGEAKRFLQRLRRALLEGQIEAAVWERFSDRWASEVASAAAQTADDVVRWAMEHMQRRTGLDADPPSARIRAWLRWLIRAAVDRLRQNLEEALTRQVVNDTELMAEFAVGRIGETTVGRVISEAERAYEETANRQVAAVAQVIVRDAGRRGFDTVLQTSQVIAVLRSEVLDENICGNCSVLDGKVFRREDWARIAPPTHCLGGSRCRGIGIPITSRETPLPEITPIESLPPMQPTIMSDGCRSASWGDGVA